MQDLSYEEIIQQHAYDSVNLFGKLSEHTIFFFKYLLKDCYNLIHQKHFFVL